MHVQENAGLSASRRALGITVFTRFDIREFHEAILKNGPLPLDLLEREVTAWIAAK